MATIAPNTASAALKQLFDRQVEIIVSAGLAFETELTRLFPLLEKIGKVTEGEGRIPFVIVIQNPTLTLTGRMAKVLLDGKSGTSYLADNCVTNLDNLPGAHYLAVDVEDGRAMRGIKPSVCLTEFKRAKRLGGTVNVGICTVMFEPEILRNHFIDLPGSHRERDNIPFLYICNGPKLDARWKGLADRRFSSLSCGSRLALGA